MISDFSCFCGWCYFLAWSLSFYPNIITSYTTKSSIGTNVNYIYLNFTGFLCLAIYSTFGYLDSSHRLGQVHLEDIGFAYHALLCTTINIVQYKIYPSINNALAPKYQLALLAIWIIIPSYSYTFFIIGGQHLLSPILLMGYTKICISLIKYLPQIQWNYVRSSTLGWNIWATYLDMIGGVMSLGQMVLDHLTNRKSSQQQLASYAINQIKLVLGLLTLGYDAILVYQHYRYKPRQEKKSFAYFEIQESDVAHI